MIVPDVGDDNSASAGHVATAAAPGHDASSGEDRKGATDMDSNIPASVADWQGSQKEQNHMLPAPRTPDVLTKMCGVPFFTATPQDESIKEGHRCNWSGDFGFSFTPTISTAVTALGHQIFPQSSSESVRVTLWCAETQKALAVADISPHSTIENAFAFAVLNNEVILQAGKEYRLSQQRSSNLCRGFCCAFTSEELASQVSIGYVKLLGIVSKIGFGYPDTTDCDGGVIMTGCYQGMLNFKLRPHDSAQIASRDWEGVNQWQAEHEEDCWVPPGRQPLASSRWTSSHQEPDPPSAKELTPAQIPCTGHGGRPQESNFAHCPTPQSFVRCGPHHRAELCVLTKSDIKQLHDLWWRYRDDLTWPWYEKKPAFDDQDFDVFRTMAQKVVDAMVEEYGQPMVLDQATISNTNHIGHPPHADNVQFDSVWWRGKRIRAEDEVVAAQEGAYILWRAEKTSYRSYSCTVSLTDPSGFDGGEVQFFEKWGDKNPILSYKCAEGCGVAFCGCQNNIHAVTGVKSGFRLVFLVWTRPPDVRVPDNQAHVCYFRPGTGLGVWLTTADMLRCQGRKHRRTDSMAWVPKDEDDGTCKCMKCVAERLKISWKECAPLPSRETFKALPSKLEPTPTTSAGNSPRTAENESPSSEPRGSTASETEELPSTPRCLTQHCPHPQGKICCLSHKRVELQSVLTKADMRELQWIWDAHKDDLSKPWSDKKPTFSDSEFFTFRKIANKVVDEMSKQYQEPLELDQATISNTNHLGHPPHADNVQFDSVWWGGRQLQQTDELVAARGGAEVLWKDSKTSYRNYSATVALTDPSRYGGGFLEFYNSWGQKDADTKLRPKMGSGVALCGCQKCIHAVTGVTWGFRLVLLVWTRPRGTHVPDDQKHVCYFRPGTGLSVWLTTADLESYSQKRQTQKSWVPMAKHDNNSVQKHN